MLKIVDKKSFIDKAERKLKDALAPFSDRNEEILIGGPNWHNTREAHWSEELRIWWAHYKLENRYENAFGVTEPHWGSGYGHALSCVIDIPFSGINRRIGGAFATEGKELFLLHRGRIGGGRKEIGKTLFMHNYRGNFIVAQDGDLYSTVALVGAMDSEKFPIQLANFVHELQRVKDYRTGRNQPYQAPLLDDFFKEEFTGTKEYSVGQVKAECDHGLVVSGLVRLLESEGHEVANRRPFDLFIYDEEGINSLFEIKTDSTTTACYTAIGQLLVYSAGMQKKPSLFAVFPESLDERIWPAFAEIGIQLVLYKWDRDKLVFDNFPP